jgi:ATP-binding cassette subfamily C protein CydC
MKYLVRIARLALPLWRWVLLGIFLSLATTLAHIALLALSSWFITSMAVAGALGIVMNYSTPSAGVRALAIGRAGGRYAERLVNHEATFRILAALRLWFFQRIEPLAPAVLQQHRSGDLLSRIRADIDLLDDFYVRGIVPVCVAVLCAVCTFAFLHRFDPRLAWVDLVGLACSGAILPVLVGHRAERPGRERVAWAAHLRASVVEQVQGLAELEALGAIDFAASRIDTASVELDDRQRRLASLQGVADAQIVAISLAAVWGSVIILASGVAAGRLPGPDMAMLMIVVLANFEIVLPLPGVIQRFGEMAEAAQRLFQIIDQKPPVAEARLGVDQVHPEVPIAAGLAVRALHFRYAPELPWVIRGLSFDVLAEKRLGLAGPTGVGKSTLVSVLLRFWEYEQGRIEVTDRDGSAFDLRSLGIEESRRLFSVVPQSPYLFHASIRDNLLIAKEGATDDELWWALREVSLSDLVASLPDRMEAVVGETGRALSVGEGQRLAIARALLRDAPIFILDEPTEGLDDPTAERLLDVLDRRLCGRTVIIISHRPRDHRIVDAVFPMALASATG